MKVCVILLAVALMAGCRRASETTEAVRQGVIEAVNGRVNLSSMDVNVTSVNFKGSQAEAMVEFRPKGGAPGSGVQMKYDLENQSGKWVVKKRADARGSPHGAMSGAGEMPPGHPPMNPPKEP